MDVFANIKGKKEREEGGGLRGEWEVQLSSISYTYKTHEICSLYINNLKKIKEGTD